MSLKWKEYCHVRAVSRDHTVYRCLTLPVQKEVVIPRRGMGKGRPRERYYIDDDPREFKTEVSMLKALSDLLRSP